jgi:hypothetical protein
MHGDLRPKLASVCPPVASIEDDDICADHLFNHGWELVKLECLGLILLGFKLHEEWAPKEFHRAIVILYLFSVIL